MFVPRRAGRSHLSHFAILGRGSQTPVQCSVKPERADLKRVFKHQAYSTLQARGGAPLFAIVTGTALVLLKARVVGRPVESGSDLDVAFKIGFKTAAR